MLARDGGRTGARASFVLCVALLLFNDHVLKGAGILPGWLTGKLSDGAGVVVAPVVLAWLLAVARVPPTAARVLAIAAVGIAFAAIKLSDAVAGGFDVGVNGVAGALALPFAARTVADPTDLLALPLLAFAWRLTPAVVEDRGLRRSGALVAGLLVCAATSPAYWRLPPHWAFTQPPQSRIWAQRLDGGAVIVQLGRQSDDGAFEVGVELAGQEAKLSLDATDARLTLPSGSVPATTPVDALALISAAPGETARMRVVFHPPRTAWDKGARGALELTVFDAGRPHALRVPLSYEERISEGRWPDLR